MRKRDFVTNTSALEEGGGLTSRRELAVIASTKGGAGMQMTIDALLTVLRKQGDWVEAQALAEAFQVTTRTVRSYVRRANKSRQIIESSHRGYRLMANAGEYAMPSARITPVAKRDNRLLMMLLSRPGAQSVYDLAEVLHVSDSSLSALFRSLRPRLSERGLHLARRREFVWIEGAERDKRRLIRHIMREHPLADFPSPVANLPAGNTLDPTETNRLVKDVLDKNELACSDFGLDNLVIHLQIMASRISLGSAISDTDLSWTGASDASQHAANEICSLVGKVLGIEINTAERSYVSLIVETNTRRGQNKPEELEFVTPSDLRIAREIAERLSWTYCLDDFSEEFIRRLAAHVNLLLRRAELGMEVPNPLLDKVKSDYPLIYDMAVRAAGIIEGSSGYAVSEDEIAFLAFHVGGYLSQSPQKSGRIRCVVLYLDYQGLGSTLTKRVDETLGIRGEVVLAEAVSDYVPDQIDCDLIVSVAPVEAAPGIRLFVVGPMMSDSDEHALKNCVEDIFNTRRGDSTTSILRRFILPDLIQFDPPVKTREEVVKLLASDCERKGLVEDGFEDDVLERERLSPTSFNNLVAIPHTLRPLAVQPFLYLIISRQPISWGKQKVNLVLLLGMAPYERESFMNLYGDLLSALADPLNASSLIESSSYEDAIERLEHIIRGK